MGVPMKRLVLVLATIVVLGAGVIARGATKSPPEERDTKPCTTWCGRRIIEDLADDPAIHKRLNLTPEQIADMRAIRDRARGNLQPLDKKVCRTTAEAYKGMSNTGASRGEIADLFEAQREAWDDEGREIMERLLDMREVLYSDQREALRILHREKNHCDKPAAPPDRTAELLDDKAEAPAADPKGH